MIVKIRKPQFYSRYVSFMKLLLPTIAAGLMGLILIWPKINTDEKHFSIKAKNIQVSNPEDPSMINARFIGTDVKNQPFSITADMAKNVIMGGSSVELEMPKADISIKDGTWVAVTANNGIYDQKSKTLDLLGKVNLFHDSGYEFNTRKATIDLGNDIATSDEKITGQGPFGNLIAEGFRIVDKGNKFFFKGKSKLVIHPNEK